MMMHNQVTWKPVGISSAFSSTWFALLQKNCTQHTHPYLTVKRQAISIIQNIISMPRNYPKVILILNQQSHTLCNIGDEWKLLQARVQWFHIVCKMKVQFSKFRYLASRDTAWRIDCEESRWGMKSKHGTDTSHWLFSHVLRTCREHESK